MPPNFIFRSYRPQTWQFHLFFLVLSKSKFSQSPKGGLRDPLLRKAYSLWSGRFWICGEWGGGTAQQLFGGFTTMWRVFRRFFKLSPQSWMFEIVLTNGCPKDYFIEISELLNSRLVCRTKANPGFVLLFTHSPFRHESGTWSGNILSGESDTYESEFPCSINVLPWMWWWMRKYSRIQKPLLLCKHSLNKPFFLPIRHEGWQTALHFVWKNGSGY